MAIEPLMSTINISNEGAFNHYMHVIRRNFDCNRDVTICALGTAIPKAIYIAEEFAEEHLAFKKDVRVFRALINEEAGDRLVPKIQIWMSIYYVPTSVPPELPYCQIVPVDCERTAEYHLQKARMHLLNFVPIELTAVSCGIQMAIEVAESLQTNGFAAARHCRIYRDHGTDYATGVECHLAKIEITMQRMLLVTAYV